MEQRCFFSSSAFICSLPIGLLVFGKIIYMKHEFVVNMNKLLVCDVYISAMWIRFNCFSCCRYSIGNSDLLNGITYGWLYTLSQINKAPYTYTISRNIHSFNPYPMNLSNYIRASYSSSSYYAASSMGDEERRRPQHLYELQVMQIEMLD